MSVYSGFATRSQETYYNTLLQTLVVALKKRLIKVYRKQPVNEDKFILLIRKLYKKIKQTEQAKYQPPKFGPHLDELIDVLGITINWDTSSTSSFMRQSNISFRLDQKTPIRPRLFSQRSKVSNDTFSDAFTTNQHEFSYSHRDKKPSGRPDRTQYQGLQIIEERQSQTVNLKHRSKSFQKKFNFLEFVQHKDIEEQPSASMAKLFQKHQKKLQQKPDIFPFQPSILLPSKPANRTNYHRNRLQIQSQQDSRPVVAPFELRKQESSDSWMQKKSTYSKAVNLLKPIPAKKEMPKLEDYLPGMGAAVEKQPAVNARMRETVRWRKNMFVQRPDAIQMQDL